MARRALVVSVLALALLSPSPALAHAPEMGMTGNASNPPEMGMTGNAIYYEIYGNPYETAPPKKPCKPSPRRFLRSRVCRA